MAYTGPYPPRSTAPLAASTQPAGKVPRVGVLEPGHAPGGFCLTGFQQGLYDLGYVEGQTIAIEYRCNEGNPDRLRALAADLVQRPPDVLWTHSPPAAQAIKQATTGSEAKHFASHQSVLSAISILYQ